MLISDLNHLEIISDSTHVKGGFGTNIDFKSSVKFLTSVKTDIHLGKGNVAASEADATAVVPYSKRTYYNTATQTSTVNAAGLVGDYVWGSASSSTGYAAVAPRYH